MLDPASRTNDRVEEAQAAAASAELTYCSDAEPGLARRRAGRGFYYLDHKGRRVEKEAILSRIRALAIPPAWTDVWIAPAENCHIQATGRDQKGRKQYRYHARWGVCRDEVKYAGLTGFGNALPAIRGRIETDLSRRGLPREKVIASVLWLMDKLMIRVGNAGYAKENRSFGLTTLRGRHVEIDGSTLRFAFRGKSGKEWRLKVTDRRIARIVRQIHEIPGQHLFQYLDDDGERRTVISQDVNAYLREIRDAGYTSKHFRTWGGTVIAAAVLAATNLPDTKRGQRIVLNEAIDQVAARLGNTRTVCRNCYIHPLVVDAWQAGELTEELADMTRRVRRAPKGLAREEAIVLRWLEDREGRA